MCVSCSVSPADSRGEVEEGPVRGRRAERSLWGSSGRGLVNGGGAFLIVVVAVQVVFEQLIVTAWHRKRSPA